jgi:hypothetical protein
MRNFKLCSVNMMSKNPNWFNPEDRHEKLIFALGRILIDEFASKGNIYLRT